MQDFSFLLHQQNAEYLRFRKLFYTKQQDGFPSCCFGEMQNVSHFCRLLFIKNQDFSFLLHRPNAEYLQFRKLFHTKRQDSFLSCCFGDMQNISQFCRCLFMKSVRILPSCITRVLLVLAVRCSDPQYPWLTLRSAHAVHFMRIWPT